MKNIKLNSLLLSYIIFYTSIVYKAFIILTTTTFRISPAICSPVFWFFLVSQILIGAIIAAILAIIFYLIYRLIKKENLTKNKVLIILLVAISVYLFITKKTFLWIS